MLKQRKRETKSVGERERKKERKNERKRGERETDRGDPEMLKTHNRCQAQWR